ncbi:MAG TPA: sigma-70 family RNA polymerase sigma factor [Candidatus Limnocylindrales bacterium]|jgi:RNA polymerase sigma-70 factor (ECF subfamily)|nr:sigma-70 family RNA polymerase sigma factor [Candidatus Limnocylindrales bacterium]
MDAPTGEDGATDHEPAGASREPHVATDPSAGRDRLLVERALGGELEAFNDLVAAYQDYLFALCVRVVGDRESAADAVQDAFYKAYRNLARFRGDAFRAWLTRIALNAATDILRERKRKPADPYPEWEDDAWQPPSREEDDPERETIRRARGRALTEALATINEDQRIAIVLFDVEGYDYHEIAAMTGVQLGTVKSRIHRGRLALRMTLGDRMELFR